LKLSEIDFTPAQAVALMRWLDSLDAQEQQRRSKEAEDAERADLQDRHYERVCELARQSAQMAGPVLGIDIAEQARAAWRSFCGMSGYFCRLDVDDMFEPEEESIFCEGWGYAYTAEIERMRREHIPPREPEARP
jgi:hypothetical protein